MDAALPLLGATNAWITPPVAISVTALIFTLASFWWMQVRRGRLRVETGHVFSGAITSNKIVLDIPLVFHNPAPACLVVADIKLCPAPGLMETSNTRRIHCHGGTTEVPGRVARAR
ncbi:hypothetical protein, partial [Micromonospora tulbaghiae]|uniref:hypothetical protein n=1 Tax=Micromonospora tulbaghiae TaxID=479978 RepID=UPI0036BADA78